MNCLLILCLLIFTKAEDLSGSYGYKWVPKKIGDALPENAARISGSNYYVGRVKHNDESVPVKISPKGSVFILPDGNSHTVDNFEVLTISNSCGWQSLKKDNQDNLVNIVTTEKGDPILIGFNKEQFGYNFAKVEEIPLWYRKYLFDGDDLEFMRCKLNTKWIESSKYMKLPENPISGIGEKYVIRFNRKDSTKLIGEFDPTNGDAVGGLEDGRAYRDNYFDILVGEPNQFKWSSSSNGTIPDNAVALMKNPGPTEVRMSYLIKFERRISNTTLNRMANLLYQVLTLNHP